MPRPPGPGRERMLDAAAELFAERGYATTTTGSISEHAGVSAGSLFYHFDSKDGLLEALMVERGFAPDLERALTEVAHDDAVDILVAVGRELLRATEERGEVLRVSLQGAVLASKHGAWLRELLSERVSMLADVLAEAGVDHERGRVAARAFISSIVVHAALVPVDGDPSVFIEDLATLLVGAT